MNARQWRKVCTLEAVAAEENLWRAAEKARRGKRRRSDVEAFELRRESELARLREELREGSWRPGPYHFFEIFEPKRRMIAAAPYRDRVVHHAMCNVLQPVLERRFIARSFSCQVGKGTKAARECCRQLVNRHRWVLKCDVRKFFPSIDHAVLAEKLEREVACPGARGLIGRILGSYCTESGDTGRAHGLPIGNLTSQLWGNFLLDGLDHRITETEAAGAYVRYTDDMLVFGDDKAHLWSLREVVRGELAALHMKLAEPKSRLLATREGVPFCGFRFLSGERPRVLGATKRRFERRWRRLARADHPAAWVAAWRHWRAFAAEGNTKGLARAYARTAWAGVGSSDAALQRMAEVVGLGAGSGR